MDFCIRAGRDSGLLKVIDEVICEKLRVTHDFGKTRKHTHTYIIYI